MKMTLPDADLPPSQRLRQRSVLIWAALLLPYVLQRRVSLASLLLVAVIWGLSAGMMFEKIGRKDTVSPPIQRQWDSFLCGWLFFVGGVGCLGIFSFALFENYPAFFPLWWIVVAAVATLAQVRFATLMMPNVNLFNRVIMFTAGTMFLLPFSAGALQYLNGALDVGPVATEQAVLISKEFTPSGNKSSARYQFKARLRDGKIRTLSVKPSLYPEVTPGQTFEVGTRRGALGQRWLLGSRKSRI